MSNSNGTVIGVVAVLLALVALGVSFFGGGTSAPSNSNVGGERAGLQEFIDGIKPGQGSEKLLSVTLPPGASQVVLYKNNTGHDVYASDGYIGIPTGETASTTFRGSMLATTTATIPASQDFAALSPNASQNRILIDGTLAINAFATSSTATSTNSNRTNSGNGTIIIPDGSYLIGYWQLNFGTGVGFCGVSGIGAGGVGGACEAATSSARGTNPVFSVRILDPKGKGF